MGLSRIEADTQLPNLIGYQRRLRDSPTFTARFILSQRLTSLNQSISARPFRELISLCQSITINILPYLYNLVQ